MQNWRDSAQLAVPGYRDRVVHIGLRPNEGGLNLAMSAELIASLAERGRCAGDRLIENFARRDPDEDYWDVHRWTRFRSSAAAIEDLLTRLHGGYEYRPGAASADPRQQATILTYTELIHRAKGAPPLPYAWPPPVARQQSPAQTG
jgi:hypothetical protein